MADAALYTKDTLVELERTNTPFITRVHATLRDCKAAIARDSPLTPVAPGYRGYWLDREYGGVNHRWLVLHSEKAFEAELPRFEKTLEKALSQARRSLNRLCKRHFTCEQDAIGALDNWEQDQTLTCVTEAQVKHIARYEKVGKPTGKADDYVY